MKQWLVYSKKADFDRIAAKYSIDKVVARIIRNRDVIGDEAMDMYLNGSVEQMYDPFLMKDMDKAVSIIGEKLTSSLKIRIIGDYDIDGINSIYILLNGLLRLGADVDYVVPDRITDGYGINENLIDDANKAGVDTIITCDNGIAAFNQVSYAKELGMTVIVTDHHDILFEGPEDSRKYIIPEADAVINPKQPDCGYPYKQLCGATVAYKLVCALYKKYGIPDKETHRFIENAAVATVGDVVDLTGENRIIVKAGLKALQNTNNIGMNALFNITKADKAKLSSYHIGFVIGPCLNASGRLDTARRAIDLLNSSSKEEAARLATDLKELNDERKAMTLKATEDAINTIENSSLKDDNVLVVFLPECHESIAGIVAGRLREKYYRPSIVLTKGEESLKGSGRSIESYNMFEKLTECKEYLLKFGGHPMAAGLSMEESKLDDFRRALNAKADLSEADLTEKIWIDVPMPIEYISEKVINDLDVLAPFGKANEKPLFADKNLKIRKLFTFGNNKQFTRMQLVKDTGGVIDAVYFSPAGELEDYYKTGQKIDITYYPEINEYRGVRNIQIFISGYKKEG